MLVDECQRLFLCLKDVLNKARVALYSARVALYSARVASYVARVAFCEAKDTSCEADDFLEKAMPSGGNSF